MPTKQQARPKTPAHLEGARSAVTLRGFTTQVDGRAFLLSRGRRLPIEHPLVAAVPDRFAPSGEAPNANPKGRDLTPPPQRVKAATSIAATAVCAEDKPCGWTTEGEPDDVARLAAQHTHTIRGHDAK